MSKITLDSDEPLIQFEVEAIEVKQPMGTFFIASIPHWRLVEISAVDVRRMLKQRDIEEYLGIQRPLNESRVIELQKYVQTLDACFPTSIVLAVPARCASFSKGKLTLNNFPSEESGEKIIYREIAKVLDGQHRIAGLRDLPKEFRFDVNVSIFVDIELEDQAYIFSIVNLAQTKVHKSLAYDLFELATTRSPQKTAHNVAVVLDRSKGSPFEGRIKRLGSATPGRSGELLTQSTVVEGLLPLISRTRIEDRDALKRKQKLPFPNETELRHMPLRGYFVKDNDAAIVDLIWNFFEAVSKRWPAAWNHPQTAEGYMLARTNGFKALMRVFPILYMGIERPGVMVSADQFFARLKHVTLKDENFVVSEFRPGTSGEAALASQIIKDLRERASLKSAI